MPERIAEILAIVAILAEYGRHLAQTLERRAVTRGFATIAQFFGTATVDTIMAHVYRGVMRAVALQRMLQARAARGRDLKVLPRREPNHRQTPPASDPAPELASPPAPSALTPAAGATAEQAARRAEAMLARHLARQQPLTLDTLPTMAQIEAQVRRASIVRSVAAICRDLGVAPRLCDGGFWNRMLAAMRLYGGDLTGVALEMRRREIRFDKEDWKHPGLELPEIDREAICRVLGFFIGEQPVDLFRRPPDTIVPTTITAPDAPAAFAATGPP